MPQFDPVVTLAILLGAALVGGLIAHRFRQPVILGYLVVGIAVGPLALGVVRDQELVEVAATMGVALLMFTLGLEVSVSQLRQVGRVGLWGAILQVLLTFGVGWLVGLTLFHWPLSQSLLFGLVISMSSTTVCLKILMDRGEMDSVHGRIMLAILILQDVSVVLMVVVVPLLGGNVADLPITLALSLGKAVLFVGISIILGLWVLPWLMGRVAGVRSRELFLLTILVLCLGAAVGTYVFGLSVVFGAFVIGLVLRESHFAHQALAEVTPLRDIFATLFFVSLGMLLSPRFVLDNWGLILLTVLSILLIKGLVVYTIVRFFGYNGQVATLAGAGLFQVGEFGFILAQSGLNAGLVTEQFYSLMLASAIITMILTPVSMSLASWLYPRLARSRQIGDGLLSPAEITNLSGDLSPVVIAGYGRVGQNIARGLRDAGLPFLVVEIDPAQSIKLKCDGVACLYGDASNAHVLAQIKLEKASALVVTFPDPLAVMTTVQAALRINPGLKIVARVHRTKEAEELRRLGVQELVSPEYEASRGFLQRIFTISGWRQADIERTLAALQSKEVIEADRELGNE
jgi:monovalent cation:H+ antiporter-2, CPA2 family